VIEADKLDVMTYCSPPRSDIWISAFHYKKLFDGNLRPNQGGDSGLHLEHPYDLGSPWKLVLGDEKAVVSARAAYALVARWDVPVVVNVAGDTPAEFGEMAAMLDGVPGVAAVELNISCPNVDVGGIDLTPARLNIEIERDGNGMPLPFTPQQLEQMDIPGLIPVIIHNRKTQTLFP